MQRIVFVLMIVLTAVGMRNDATFTARLATGERAASIVLALIADPDVAIQAVRPDRGIYDPQTRHWRVLLSPLETARLVVQVAPSDTPGRTIRLRSGDREAVARLGAVRAIWDTPRQARVTWPAALGYACVLRSRDDRATWRLIACADAPDVLLPIGGVDVDAVPAVGDWYLVMTGGEVIGVDQLGTRPGTAFLPIVGR